MEIKEYSFDAGRIVINYAEIPSAGIFAVLLHADGDEARRKQPGWNDQE